MNSSRRSFLATGLALPAAGLAVPTPGRTGLEPALPDPPPPQFQYQTLGKTAVKVTRLGFGCMITSDPSVIERGADIGITYFDTARGYQSGNNERMVGAAIKAKRKGLCLSTKTGAGDKAGALAHLETSLKELGTDYIDVWYLHGKSKAADLTDDLLEAQQIAKQQGKIRFAGVSIHRGHEEVMPAAIQSGKIDVMLISYNFTMGKNIDALIAKAKQAGIGIVAMKVMAGGFRTNKEGTQNHTILKREGAMTAALKWVLRNPNIDTTIPSMTDMDQLDDNLKAASVKFTGADEKVLTAYLDRIRPLYCRMCDSCDGVCPKGVPVADVLRILTYAEGYGQFALARERFLELPAEVAAVRCGECTSCAVECPNGVHVAERLIHAQELFA